jgi:exopolysaccharide biosynthesis polyprenyl glycosylphosphotransferase
VLRHGFRLVVLADVVGAVCALAAIGEFGWPQCFVVLVTMTLYASAGLYASRLALSVLDDFPSLAGRALVGMAVVTLALSATRNGLLSDDLVPAGIAMTLAILVMRTGFYAGMRAVRRSGAVAHHTLIIGAGTVGGRIAAILREHREYGLRPVGFCDADPLLASDPLPLPVLGGPDDLGALLREYDVNVVIVAFSTMREPRMVQVLRTCDRHRCEIFFVPRLFEMHALGGGVDSVWGLPLVRLRRSVFRTPSWRLKRVLDVTVSGLALLLLAPLLAACALAVRIEGGRGVLFRQERVGLDGRPFQLLKFRSLRPVDDDESRTRWTVAHDARMGRVGRFLRATSLDELPQLLNILRGDMSLVGPRPERPHFVDEFSRTYARYGARHRVPAGLTGLAQVHGLRGDTSIEDRAHFDNAYIENWSLWVDVKILMRTALAVVRRTGS